MKYRDKVAYEMTCTREKTNIMKGKEMQQLELGDMGLWACR